MQSTDGLLVLMYHAIVTTPKELAALPAIDRPYAVWGDEFRAHLTMLRDQGCRTLFLTEAVDQINGSRPLAPDAVTITFDDGLDSFRTQALPLLREFSMQAGVFITAGMLGTPGWLSADDARLLAKQGVGIGSHGISHRLFSTMSAAELMQELRGSKEILEQALGQPVDLLSLPGGRQHHDLQRLAIETGYRAVFTSRPGLNQSGADAGGIGRVAIKGATTRDEFRRILRKDPGSLAAAERAYNRRSRLRTMFGEKIYWKLYEFFTS
jgi:peptidoglycan/xylan/chitin deacetylase (PgdA/CDA1 family)